MCVCVNIVQLTDASCLALVLSGSSIMKKGESGGNALICGIIVITRGRQFGCLEIR